MIKEVALGAIMGASVVGGMLHAAPKAQVEPQIHHQEPVLTQDFKDIDSSLNNSMEAIKEQIAEARKPKYYVQECIITYYTASDDECGKQDGITASGKPAQEGRTVAADHLPLGTVVEINGNQYVVEDRFGGGHSNKIDIYVESKHDAIQRGTMKVEVKIYERG